MGHAVLPMSHQDKGGARGCLAGGEGGLRVGMLGAAIDCVHVCLVVYAMCCA